MLDDVLDIGWKCRRGLLPAESFVYRDLWLVVLLRCRWVGENRLLVLIQRSWSLNIVSWIKCRDCLRPGFVIGGNLDDQLCMRPWERQSTTPTQVDVK